MLVPTYRKTWRHISEDRNLDRAIQRYINNAVETSQLNNPRIIHKFQPFCFKETTLKLRLHCPGNHWLGICKDPSDILDAVAKRTPPIVNRSLALQSAGIYAIDCVTRSYYQCSAPIQIVSILIASLNNKVKHVVMHIAVKELSLLVRIWGTLVSNFEPEAG
jgi:hypothetical protein